ncbi:ATP-dependent DNA helicase RecQ [Porites harrisoni]
MADEIMADVSEDRNLQNRPLHHAYLRCKLPWPHIECRGDARKVFFEEKGLAQHFRIKHARVVFDNVKQVREAWRLFRYLHGEETKEHSRRLSAERQLLKAYGEGAQPVVIEVNKPGLSVHFNAWHSKVTVSGQSVTRIVAEAVFVKRDFTVASLQDVTPVDHHNLTGGKALDTLRGVFHYQQFRGCQQESIHSVLSGQNTLRIMPTGGGKTICHQVPAVMEQKITVVIFPLLALLLDQVERLRSRGLNVCYLMSEMAETHCIDMWGFHFRPSYSELWKLTEFGRPILAMTGTATKRTEDAILKSLRLPADTVVVRQCSNRPNLLYHVLEKKSDGKDALVELIKKEFTGQCGIVYCVERSDTVDIAYRLKVAGNNRQDEKFSFFVRYCTQAFRSLLANMEQSVSQATSVNHAAELDQILPSYKLSGFPISMSFTEIPPVPEAVFSTGVHAIEDPDVEFALAVHVHPYPQGVFSLWIYVGTLRRKSGY